LGIGRQKHGVKRMIMMMRVPSSGVSLKFGLASHRPHRSWKIPIVSLSREWNGPCENGELLRRIFSGLSMVDE